MTTLDLITRAEFIYKKYQKYLDEDKNKERLLNTDAFGEAVFDFESQISSLMEVRAGPRARLAPVAAPAPHTCLRDTWSPGGRTVALGLQGLPGVHAA